MMQTGKYDYISIRPKIFQHLFSFSTVGHDTTIIIIFIIILFGKTCFLLGTGRRSLNGWLRPCGLRRHLYRTNVTRHTAEIQQVHSYLTHGFARLMAVRTSITLSRETDDGTNRLTRRFHVIYTTQNGTLLLRYYAARIVPLYRLRTIKTNKNVKHHTPPRLMRGNRRAA